MNQQWPDSAVSGPIAERIAFRLNERREQGSHLQSVTRIDVGMLPPAVNSILLSGPIRLFVSCSPNNAGGAIEYTQTTTYIGAAEIDIVGKAMAPSSLEGWAEFSWTVDELVHLICEVEQQQKWGETEPSPFGRRIKFVTQGAISGARSEDGGLGTVDGMFFFYQKLVWPITCQITWQS